MPSALRALTFAVHGEIHSLNFLHFLHFFAGMKTEIFLGVLAILSLFQKSASSSHGIVLFSGFAGQGFS